MATTLRSQLPTPSKQAIYVPREGSLLKFVGGLALAASFFMPALYMPSKSISHTALSVATLDLNIANGYLLVAIVPIFYLLGLTTSLVMFFGRFTQSGVSRGLLALHLLEMVLVVVASGTALVLSLTLPQQVGSILVPLALLGWLALTINFVAIWLRKGQSFIQRVVKGTQITSALNVLLFSIILLDTLFYTDRRIDTGLVVAFAGSFLMMWSITRSEN